MDWLVCRKPWMQLPGQAADLLQVTRDTLRHWERNGLIDPPRDPDNSYRRYGANEIGRLRVLRLLTRAGYSTMAVLRTVRSMDLGRRANLTALRGDSMKSQLASRIEEHMDVLVNQIGERPGGSPGCLRAEDYIASRFTGTGLTTERQAFDCPARIISPKL